MGISNKVIWAGVGTAAVALMAGVGIWGASALTSHTNTTALSTQDTHTVSDHITTSPGKTVCAGCTTVFSATLPHGAHLDGVLQGENTGWLDYYSGGRLVTRTGLSETKPQQYDEPTTGHCQVVGGVQRCAVAYDTGAHAGAVVLVKVNPGKGIEITDRAAGDSSDASVNDLNKDGLSDAAVVESTFDPDYASAPQFWHTYVQRGGKLVSTGCTKPSTTPQPAPTTVATGSCPS
jgi:hypothetical protein